MRRVQEDLSMQELARRLGIAHSTVSRWEHPADPSTVTRTDVDRIAIALNLDDPRPRTILVDQYVLALAAGFVPDAAAHFLCQPPVIDLALAWLNLAHEGQQAVLARLRELLERADA